MTVINSDTIKICDVILLAGKLNELGDELSFILRFVFNESVRHGIRKWSKFLCVLTFKEVHG